MDDVDLEPLWDELDRLVPPILERYRARVHALRTQTKPDDTLVTDADSEVEECIVAALRSAVPEASVVAEEASHSTADQRRSARWTWIVDPIDGTAQFVQPGATEFASVVALLDDRRPVAAWILLPEAGAEPVRIRATSSTVSVNAVIQTRGRLQSTSHDVLASVTGSSSALTQAMRAECAASGTAVKTKATSQTIDMARTALDLRWVSPALTPMVAFVRENQKVWDGAAGMVLAGAMGTRLLNQHGRDATPIEIDLGVREPSFPVTFAGTEVAARWFATARRNAALGVA